MRIEILTLIAISIAFLQVGCSVWSDPSAVQSIDNDKSKVLITQADKRAIFIFKDKAAYACPEPSPDVRADIDATVKALLDVSAKLPQDITPTAKAELDSTRKLITAALLQRSQGLQVLRDMLFQACLANLRGDMEPTRYVSFITQTLPTITTTLIAAEMVTRNDGAKPILSGADLQALFNFILGNMQ
jgi:hypothetical protein